MEKEPSSNIDEIKSDQSNKEKPYRYDYFVNHNPDPNEKWVDVKHSPVENAQATEVSESLKNGASAWNVSGTWEEKVLSFSDFLNFVEKNKNLMTYEGKKLDEVKDLSGHIKVIFSRGKKRIGFELHGNIVFSNIEVYIKEANDYGDFECDKPEFENLYSTLKETIKKFVDSVL